MTDLVVIVPSRGRPEAVAELAQAFLETCTADTHMLVAIDSDDPARTGYGALGDHTSFIEDHSPSNMVGALNKAAQFLTRSRGYVSVGGKPPILGSFALGFMGDDHRPRTVGWDAAYLEALRDLGTGIVYGNDLLQGERIPTQVAMTADIVQALGFMAPPGLHHLYVDNFWKDLGTVAGCLRYLPDVVVEHLHPVAGKAQWDEGYKRVNAPEVYQRDARAYEAFHRSGGFAAAVQKVRQLRAARV